MHEKHWVITAADGARIYGALNRAGDVPTRYAIIMVHGLTGDMNTYHHKIPSLYFTQNGFDVVRFNLYDDQDGARKLRNCTLATHAADVNDVAQQLGADYDGLFFVGHSFGAPTLMTAQPARARAVSLWDPTFNLPAVWKDRRGLTREGDLNILNWGVSFVIGDAMIDEARTKYSTQECLALSSQFARPVQVIHAADGFYASHDTSWHSTGNPANERHIVPHADHCFYNGNTLYNAMDLTLSWFKRWS